MCPLEDRAAECSLLARCIARDGEAWREITSRYEPGLTRRVCWLLGTRRRDQSLIADLVEAVWVSLVRYPEQRLRGFDRWRGCLGAYLNRLAWYEWVRQARRHARHREQALTREVVDACAEVWSAEVEIADLCPKLTAQETELVQARLAGVSDQALRARFGPAYLRKLEHQLRRKIHDHYGQ